MLEQLAEWALSLRPAVERAMVVALHLHLESERTVHDVYWRLAFGVTAALDDDGRNRFELESLDLEQLPSPHRERHFEAFKRDIAQMEAFSRQVPDDMHYYLLTIDIRPLDGRRPDSWSVALPIFPWTIDEVSRGSVPPQREWINMVRRAAGGGDEPWAYMGLDIHADGVSVPELAFIHGGERGARGGPRAKAWRALQAEEATSGAMAEAEGMKSFK